MKIGFYIGYFNLNNVNKFDLTKGNPGIGGTEYIFLLLASLLSARPDFDVYVYCSNNVSNLAPFVKSVYIENIEEAIVTAKEDEVDYFIFAPSTEKKIYDLIDNTKLKSITWMQNRFTYDIANYISNCSSIVINVCASREQYDCIIDHDIWIKSVIIKNCIFQPEINNNKKNTDLIVTYMGHLSYNRGFHILARQWKKVIKKVPNAKLYVIGSANLYNNDTKLGDLGIADIGYENKFKKYITDSEGEILDSIHFCGKLGMQKYDIFSKTKVGIVNPFTREMGPLSALEMEVCSIPVVSIRRYGQMETILHNYSGLLVFNKMRIWKSIVKLLTDENLHTNMSKNAKQHVIKNYSPNVIINQWITLFNDLGNNKKISPLMPEMNYLNDFKWLRIINRKAKSISFFMSLPSVLFYEKSLKIIVKNISNNIKG